MKKYLLLAALSLCLIISISFTFVDNSDWLVANWKGTAYEPQSMSEYTLELNYDVETESFMISSPSFPCKGTWELQSVDERKAVFIERISEGDDICIDFGDIVVTKINDEHISMAYFISGHPDEVVSFAVLRKE